eukprot:8845889-Pyramimonas_sp.AAC.1
MIDFFVRTLFGLLTLGVVLRAQDAGTLETPSAKQRTFTIEDGNFVQDGRPMRIFSGVQLGRSWWRKSDAFRLAIYDYVPVGSVHYWRVPAAYWEHRLTMLKHMGLNTVETYVPWFLHEPAPGNFTTAGDINIIGFINVAHKLGLNVILRPGGYLAAVDRYFDWLMPLVAPLQYSLGGPIIAMQVRTLDMRTNA